MDITKIVAQNYAANKPATSASTGAGSSAFLSSVKSFHETLAASESLAQQAMVSQADPHALVNALAQTELAVQTVVSVRDKVVEAYQEILRMPV